MKLTASLIVHDELSRYLEPCIGGLLEFCDEVRVLDDASRDGWDEYLADAWGRAGRRVLALREDEPGFFTHEGRARQRLLDWTLAGEPTHVLALDADEFIADGAALRRACTDDLDVWACCMQEVWNADGAGLDLRQDGGWAETDVPVLWRPAALQAPRIADRALACGRVPEGVSRLRGGHTCTAILHFGWANRAERAARHERYAVADGGRYHARAHLDSILLPDDRVTLNRVPWPAGIAPHRAEAILDHAGVKEIVPPRGQDAIGV